MRWWWAQIWNKSTVGEVTFNKKTSKENKLLVGKGMVCNKRKSMIVSDNGIQAEGLGDFFKNLGKKWLNVSKKMAKDVLSNHGRALDLTAKIAQQLLLEILKRLCQHYQN